MNFIINKIHNVSGHGIDHTFCGRSMYSVYEAALLENNNVVRELLSTAMHLHKWWSPLKSFLFGVNASLSIIRIDGGFVAYNPSIKANGFSIVFQNKHCDQDLNLPSTSFPKPKLTCFAFKSSKIIYYL